MPTSKKDKLPEYEIKWWKDWLEADCLERQGLVEKLPFFRMCLQMENRKMWKRMFSRMLNSYFEDLESAVYTKMARDKIANEKKTKKASGLGCFKSKQ